jgi:RNA polymerase sigma factor (sigma-70 family)
MSVAAGTLTEAVTRHLIEQTGLGNQQAFEELCRRYEKPLFRVALKILRDADMARDVLQDALLAIWKSSKRFKGDSKPFTWMWAIVRRKAMDALRNRLRSPGDAQEEAADSGFREKPELDAVISDALRKLSPEHRLVVILTYYFNFSQYHISQILHCPVGTVKSRLSNALRQLGEAWNTPLKLGRFPVGKNDLD